MNENTKCPIWGTAASVQYREEDDYFVDSPRADGEYFIDRRVAAILRNREDELNRTGSDDEGFEQAGATPSKVERLKARLTSWLVEERRFSDETPK